MVLVLLPIWWANNFWRALNHRPKDINTINTETAVANEPLLQLTLAANTSATISGGGWFADSGLPTAALAIEPSLTASLPAGYVAGRLIASRDSLQTNVPTMTWTFQWITYTWTPTPSATITETPRPTLTLTPVPQQVVYVTRVIDVAAPPVQLPPPEPIVIVNTQVIYVDHPPQIVVVTATFTPSPTETSTVTPTLTETSTSTPTLTPTATLVLTEVTPEVTAQVTP